jgi:hypothetical protein
MIHKYSINKAMLVLSLLFMASVDCQLRVYGPEDLKGKFDGGAIEARYANFGFIPYGHSLVSSLIYFFSLLTRTCSFSTETSTRACRSPTCANPSSKQSWIRSITAKKSHLLRSSWQNEAVAHSQPRSAMSKTLELP